MNGKVRAMGNAKVGPEQARARIRTLDFRIEDIYEYSS